MLRRVFAVSVGIIIAASSCTETTVERYSPFYLVNEVDLSRSAFDRVQFESFRKGGLLTTAITFGGETRLSLAPPLPSKLPFTVRVPPEAVLRFGIGISPIGDAARWPPIAFVITVRSSRGEEELFSERLTHAQAEQWFDYELDLGRWEGELIELTLDTKLARATNRIPWTARAVLPLWSNPVLSTPLHQSPRPNLIVISIDCLRADHVGTYGYSRPTTPEIDRLASDGVVYEVAVSTSSWTLPTHMSMFTGRLPSFHGVVDRWSKLDRSVVYGPELLAEAGYEVNGISSWYFTSQLYGFERGFHLYRFLKTPTASTVVSEAIDLIRSAKGRDQFLFVHILDPHHPYLPPEEFRAHFGEPPEDISGVVELPTGIAPESAEQTQQVVDLYDGEVAYVDREVGRLLRELEARDIYESSLIILTSDHGEAFYEHGQWQHGETLYEEATRIPLIVKWPGNTPTGRVTTPVSQVDIFPTLLDVAGLDVPRAGPVHLKQPLEDEGSAGSPRSIVSEITWAPVVGGTWPPVGIGKRVAIRSGGFKYIATLGAESDDVVEEELYDLSEDPSEKNDLTEAEHPRLALFRSELRRFVTETRGAAPRGERVILDDETKERLRSLGYITH